MARDGQIQEVSSSASDWPLSLNFFFFFFFCCFFFLPHPQHMEVPRPEIDLRPTPKLQQRWILKPQHQVRD